jgi:GDP-D-mannose 3', 5'-epimerase
MSEQKQALVLGGGGFIGGHLITRLKNEGFWVRSVDLKFNEFYETDANDFVIGDLRDQNFVNSIIDRKFDEVYQLAADMGGAGYIFTGENDADIMYNSALINLNVVESCRKRNIQNVFYSSSACIYPEHNQLDPDNPNCEESSAYPANPDSEYGWEKLFSERIYLAYNKNHNMRCRVARYHNIYGPLGTWDGGKEKAPAALCRKVANATEGSSIDIWGDGKQTRSFLYIDQCVEATLRVMRSEIQMPVNIGSEEMISINDLAELIISISGKNLSIENIPGPVGVRGRNSDNRLIKSLLGWEPYEPLSSGLEQTYEWISGQVHAKGNRR